MQEAWWIYNAICLDQNWFTVYDENKLEQEKNLTENIENACATITDNAEKTHSYYIFSKWKCTDIMSSWQSQNEKRIKSSNINGCLTQQWLSVVTLVFGVWLTLMILGCFVPFVKWVMSLSQKMIPRFGTQSPMLDIK